MNPVMILVIAAAILFMYSAYKNQTPASVLKNVISGVYAQPKKGA
jgi:hypothetical protein